MIDAFQFFEATPPILNSCFNVTSDALTDDYSSFHKEPEQHDDAWNEGGNGGESIDNTCVSELEKACTFKC